MYYIAAIAAYVVSKAGAAKLYDQVAAEHADVRVFNLHPGLVKTAMSKKAGMDTLPADEPELPAAMTVYLASPEGDFLKGRFVWASWDVQELKEMRAEIEATEMWGRMGLVGWDGFKHTSKAPWE